MYWHESSGCGGRVHREGSGSGVQGTPRPVHRNGVQGREETQTQEWELFRWRGTRSSPDTVNDHERVGVSVARTKTKGYPLDSRPYRRQSRLRRDGEGPNGVLPFRARRPVSVDSGPIRPVPVGPSGLVLYQSPARPPTNDDDQDHVPPARVGAQGVETTLRTQGAGPYDGPGKGPPGRGELFTHVP